MIRRNWIRRLLAPTVGFQKSLFLFVVGVIALIAGAVMSFNLPLQNFIKTIEQVAESGVSQFVLAEETDKWVHWIGALLLLMGAVMQYYAARLALNHIIETLNPGMKTGKVDMYMRRQQLAEGPNIVAIGGGTGLSTLLQGLKQHSSNITAIVTVTDDGGSSGKLVQELGIMPPGDIRNCLVALAESEKEITDLFNHRFKKDDGNLSGHSLGNLLIAALWSQAKGDFEQAIAIASKVLAIRGRVMPSTLNRVGLRAKMDNDELIFGEENIVKSGHRIVELRLDSDAISAYAPAIEAILDADIICIGPGSVYTSIVPNLLIPGITAAIKESTAFKVYICNVMTQQGESDSFSASQHVSAILNQVKERTFDYVMVNTGVPSESSLEKYKHSGQTLVDPDIDLIKAMGIKVIQGNYMSESDVVRHDPVKVVSKLMSVLKY